MLLQMVSCWIGQRMIRVVSSMLSTVLVILIAQSSISIIHQCFFFILYYNKHLVIYLLFLTRFYTECFGMKVSRQRDVPKEKYSNAFMGFGSEKSHFAVELTYIIYILSCLLLELTHFQIFPKSTCALYHKTETTWFLC